MGVGEEFDSVVEGLADLSDVVRASYIMAHLSKLKDVITEADTIAANFPKVLREQLECESCSHDTTLNTMAKGKLALAFAQLSPDIRHAVRVMLEETEQYVGVWMEDDTTLYGQLDTNDVAVVEEMVAFVQKIGSRSTRNLLNFLRAVNNDDEQAYLLMKGHGRSSEVRMRHRVSPETLTEFEIQ